MSEETKDKDPKGTDGSGEKVEGETPAADTTPAATTPAASEPAVVVDSGNPVKARLLELGLDSVAADTVISKLGPRSVEDLNGLREEDLTAIGVPALPARKVINSLKTAAMSSASPVATGVVSIDGILPEVPGDASWLEALRSGGVLKVEQSTVIAAIRAALAHKAGLFKVPALLGSAMESFADMNDEQVDPEFFKLRKQLTRRSYADIFEAIDGLDGNYVTDARKKQLFERIDNRLWPSIMSYHTYLKNWYETWAQTSNNPTMLMNLVLGAATGGVGPAMPPVQPPDTGVLHDAAGEVADSVNSVFAGTGVQIAAALAYDATQIKETLNNSRLPAMIGVASRDLMLKKLGVAVSPTYPRLEINLVKFVLGILNAKNVAGGNEELAYFGALYMLGQQIDWSQAGGTTGYSKSKGMGIGGREI